MLQQKSKCHGQAQVLYATVATLGDNDNGVFMHLATDPLKTT